LCYGTKEELVCGYEEYYATNASGSWVETPLIALPFGGSGVLKAWFPSLTIDASDHVHIAYGAAIFLDGYTGSFLTHASNTTGRLRPEIVTWEGSESFLVWTSVTMDNANRVHIVYGLRDEDDSTVRIHYATNTHGAWFVSGPLSDPIEWELHNFYNAPSIGVDSSGQVYISYIDTDNRLLVISGEREDLSPTWPGTPAEASAYGQASKVGSSLFNNLAILLMPIGAVILLRVLRRST
jgi:hypothetical protein